MENVAQGTHLKENGDPYRRNKLFLYPLPDLRYGLVVRIPGSHPGGPGSIPGNGNFFSGGIIGLSCLAGSIVLRKVKYFFCLF